MTIHSKEDIDKLKEIGRIVAMTIQEMKRQARIGMTTKELDEIGAEFMSRYGAVSSPFKEYAFPGHTCISLNNDIAHGIPGDRVIQAGDRINIDVCAEKDGYVADSGHSFQMAPHDPTFTRLSRHTHDTMMKVIRSLKSGVRLNEIGRIMEEEAAKAGFKVIKNLCSHGVGRAIHESPKEILPYYNKHDKRKLAAGAVITIEPFLSTGAEYVIGQPDGWTLSVPDNSMAAQHEHTIIITDGRPIIVTAA